MTKAELIESVASKVDLPRAVAERAVNTMFEDIVESAGNRRQGERVRFRTFSVSTGRPRNGRNPKTGESIEIPASRAAKFKSR